MKIIITSKNLNASDHLRETIEKKLYRLGKFFSDDIVANVTLSAEGGRQRIETTINANGTIFRAEEETPDIYNGIDKITDKLSSQISKYKTKLLKKHKDNRSIVFEDVPDMAEEGSEAMEIVRRKKFDLMPMTAEEAILQMELINHTFFIFLNMDTNNIGVVYKRNDGKYGLLETSF